MSPDEWQERFDEAAAAAQREYCNIFEFWRACRYKPCRRSKVCRGDQLACLKRGVHNVPYETHYKARDQILAATPADAERPVRTARNFLPNQFW